MLSVLKRPDVSIINSSTRGGSQSAICSFSWLTSWAKALGSYLYIKHFRCAFPNSAINCGYYIWSSKLPKPNLVRLTQGVWGVEVSTHIRPLLNRSGGVRPVKIVRQRCIGIRRCTCNYRMEYPEFGRVGKPYLLVVCTRSIGRGHNASQ